MRLKVYSHVPRNTPGGQTGKEKDILPADAGKPDLEHPYPVSEASWPARAGVEDPWSDAKAGRWMSRDGQTVMRAGLLAWKGAGKKPSADPRRTGILVAGLEGAWPEWLEGKSPAEIAARWRSHPPLWLLECLPNLPAAELAIEIGARGPVETRRGRMEDGVSLGRILRRWQGQGVQTVLVARLEGGSAKAEVWQL